MAKVLLLEDIHAVRLALSLTVEMFGHECIAPETPEHFERFLDEVDLVISDLTMPFVSGEQVIERTRQLKPDMPILILTGNVENADQPVERLKQLGASDVAFKPVDIDELKAAMAPFLPH